VSPNERLLLEHAADVAAAARLPEATRPLADAVAERVARLLLAESRRDPRLRAVLAELYPLETVTASPLSAAR
jgi:hypothetical protein